MNYIKKVKLENFQSHAVSELEFVNGLNVIVGPSDQGKSAIIRAIKWVLFNEPSGIEFKRHGTNNVRVTLDMSNGYSIVRERTPSKNRYLIIDPEGVSNEYGGFSNGVPLEVKKVHNIYKVVIDDNSKVSLNIGDQLESAFLLSASNGTKAKAIGRLTGVHIIDNAIRETNSDIKKDNQFKTNTENEIDSIVAELETYNDLAELKNKIDRRKQRIEEAETKINNFNKLKLLQTRINQIVQDIEQCKAVMIKYKDIENMQLKLSTINEKVVSLDRLKALQYRLSEINSQVSKLNNILEGIKDVDRLSVLIKKAEQSSKQLEDMKKINNAYTEIQNRILNGNKFLQDTITNINTISVEYKKILKELGKCPLCFSNIDEHKIDEIVATSSAR